MINCLICGTRSTEHDRRCRWYGPQSINELVYQEFQKEDAILSDFEAVPSITFEIDDCIPAEEVG